MQCIRMNQIKLPLGHSREELEEKIQKRLGIKREALEHYEIIRQSIDARKKPDLQYVYSVDVYVKPGIRINKKVLQADNAWVTPVHYSFVPGGREELLHRPVIVGLGPAGLFCGYYLAKYGYRPIIIERGEDVDRRQKTVEHFWETGDLDTESNVQFGEGGAGTFSDGKLNTLVKDKTGRNGEVLKTFVQFGAKDSICYVNKPHIGTDELKHIVKNIRQEIIRLGGEIRFRTRLTDLLVQEEKDQRKLTGIILNETERLDTDVLVLAVGHSARDTFAMLYEKDLAMSAKAFAVGYRMEHPQTMINYARYGVDLHEKLEAADYKVTYNTDTHGIYSFCMCPGGYVVNASSEAGRLAVNGMSYSDRSGINSNSAIVVTVTPEDYGNTHPLAGMEFQREIEAKAYQEGKGKIPVQCFGDFCENRITKEFGQVMPQMKGMYRKANLRNILPEELNQQLIEGIHGFSRQITGFDQADAVLSGVESRTSSPVRIERDAAFQSVNLAGLYPCGEGAGYAGGITSAAMDGLRVFEAVASRYAPFGSR